MGKTLVEICANGLDSALIAQAGGADRIELCRALEVDGLTPDPKTIGAAVDQLSIPIHLLVRPRGGNFCYSEEEIKIIISQIEMARDLGCKGIVCGALTNNDEIELQLLERFIEASGGLHFTFHRAFDSITDQVSALEQLIDLQIDRVLTSGGKSTAIKGIKQLTELQNQAKGRIEIMPGSGINSTNVGQLLASGFGSIHLSASRSKQSQKNTPLQTQLEEVEAVMQEVEKFSSN